MAQGKWVNIPGKGRRWQQPSGELMMEKPGIGFVQAQLSPVTGFLGSIFKSSGLPAYQMSGPGLQQVRQQQTQDYYRQRGLSSLGPEYKEQELAAGADAERSRPGAGFPGQQVGGNLTEFTAPGTPGAGSFAPINPYAAQNREYERERARVEAMVKANPDMQKQAIADERAKVRDQGMAIWAAKYGGPGGLASKVKPGAVGYDAIQRGIGIQSIPSIENRAEFSWNQATQGPTPAVPMADAMLNPSSPGFIGGEGPPPVNFNPPDPGFENMSPEKFQELLNQYTKR
jgi:hypothetical protein